MNELSENVTLELGIMNEYTISETLENIITGKSTLTRFVITEYNHWIDVFVPSHEKDVEDINFTIDKSNLDDFITILNDIKNREND